MGAFLDRYLQGEHKAVWDELVTMGDAIRATPIYADAIAVARETMRRARYNIETLIPRLVAVGYQFGYGWAQPFVRERLLYPYHANYDPARGGAFAHGLLLQPAIPAKFTTAQRLAYMERLDLARYQPPLFLPATDNEERADWLAHEMVRQPGMAKSLSQTQETLRTKLTPQEIVAQVEAQLGTLPLSIRAWYEIVGGVNFVGDCAGWHALLPESDVDFPTNENDYLNPMHVLDPLVICPLDENRLEFLKQFSDHGSGASLLTLSDDEYGKYLDGARELYQVAVPSPAMDAPLLGVRSEHELTFVAYLSECFRWAGFPGWAKLNQAPDEDLAFLTKDLLPIY